MKIAFTTRTIKDGFTVIETEAFNTRIRASRALREALKGMKPQIDGTTAVNDQPAASIMLTAQVRNGFTNLYLTIKKQTAKDEGGDLPF